MLTDQNIVGLRSGRAADDDDDADVFVWLCIAEPARTRLCTLASLLCHHRTLLQLVSSKVHNHSPIPLSWFTVPRLAVK